MIIIKNRPVNLLCLSHVSIAYNDYWCSNKPSTGAFLRSMSFELRYAIDFVNCDLGKT